MSLSETENAARKCTKCGLWKSRAKAAPGEGPKNAKIMLVGEAPGAEEDLHGRPFVGRAGRLLDGLLQGTAKRPDLYITSVLKCRPPENRNPRGNEVEKCMPWLEEQIELIKPAVIGLMGNIAIKSLLGKTGISKLHGTFAEKDGRKFLLLYHPAAGVYNANLIPQMKKDYAKLAEFL